METISIARLIKEADTTKNKNKYKNKYKIQNNTIQYTR